MVTAARLIEPARDNRVAACHSLGVGGVRSPLEIGSATSTSSESPIRAGCGHIAVDYAAEYEGHYTDGVPHQPSPPTARPDYPTADLARNRSSAGPTLGASLMAPSGPRRSPGQGRWPSSGIRHAFACAPKTRSGRPRWTRPPLG